MSLKTTILASLAFASTLLASPDFSMIGFATINGKAGQVLAGGTTGGKGGTVVTVSNAADFLKYIADPAPYIIYVSGTIALPASPKMYEVKSNKSIIGVGSNAAITSAGLNIGPIIIDDKVTAPPANATNNIIIRNITFTGSADDLINVQMFSHHIWIDHCDFSKSFDGTVDIKRGSDWVTVSWNVFHDHNKTCLLGHDDANGAQDEGRLHVTYHHNFFNATTQRHPRVRFGEAHVYNNYYYNNGDYGIGVGIDAKINSENNYFIGLEDASQYYNSTGWLKDVGSIIDTSVETFELKPDGVNWTPSQYYTYTADAAKDVKTIVMQYAGVGKIDPSTVVKHSTLVKNVNVSNVDMGLFSIQGRKTDVATKQTNASSLRVVHKNTSGSTKIINLFR